MLDWDDGSDDDEATGENEPEYGRHSATVFLIEATEPMFTPDFNDQSYFKKCIECCKSFLLQEIRSSKKGPVAILLFGTKQGTDSWNNISVLQDLAIPSATRVKELTKILESEDFDGFDKKYGHSSDFSVANAMWYSHILFAQSKTKFSPKHIIMLTCTPNPHADDPDKQKQAKIRAGGLNETSVILNVVPLGSRFDKAFYSELAAIVNGEDKEEVSGVEEPSESVEEIIRRMYQCASPKRSTARVPWHLGKGVKLSAAVYNLVQPCVPAKKKFLSRETHAEVEAKTQTFNPETGEVVRLVKEKKFVEYGEQKIYFDADEWKRAKRIGGNGLVLLGFKPKSSVEYFVQKSAFIYPDETMITGSRILFAALHQRCSERNVAPICVFKPRKVSPPKLVALWPQDEKLDAQGFQIAAAGFVVIYLPYANYIRDLSPVYTKTDPKPEVKDVVKEIVRKLKTNYDPCAIKDPKIHKHWVNLEAIALGLEETEEVRDETLPDNEHIKEALGDITEKFKDLGYDFEASGSHSKAKRTQSTSENPAKRQKLELNVEDMKNIVQAHQVHAVTVDNLKKYLRSEGVRFSASLKKADLVKLIYDHFEVDP